MNPGKGGVKVIIYSCIVRHRQNLALLCWETPFANWILTFVISMTKRLLRG